MRAALFCPGRGSYTKKSLRSLPADHPWVQSAEALRAEYGLTALLELDGAKKFHPPTHLKPSNISPLIYLCTMLDAKTAADEHEIVAVGGNSLGWYTALAVGGALGFEDGFRLVQTMSLLQEEFSAGGQILYPMTDEHWRPSAKLVAGINEAMAEAAGEAFPSINLGGYAVLAGTEAGIETLLEKLPAEERGPTIYPIRLAQHGPYHTPLLQPVAERARKELAKLEFRCPATALIDGMGRIHGPASADPAALRDYTLGEQIYTPYGFTESVRVALREFAPARLVLPGPGNSLGGICGQILALEGWRGIKDRDTFDAVQDGDDPIVISMRRF
ncbi:MAG: ACP S-malonyltransferase [Planctomycetota bacterium]